MKTMYEFNYLIDKLQELGINSRTISNNYRQFEERTTLHLKKRTKEYVFYTTDDMFTYLATRFTPKSIVKHIDGTNMNKEEVEKAIIHAKNENTNYLIFVRYGNLILHPSSPQYQPHEVITVSNSTLDITLNCISEYIGNGKVTNIQSGRYTELKKMDKNGNVWLVHDNIKDRNWVCKNVPADVFDIYRKIATVETEYVSKVVFWNIENERNLIFEEYIEGDTIGNIIDSKGCISKETSVKYTKQMLFALSEIHELGIIHKDISPNNVIIDENDNVKIIDFGISREYKPGRSEDTMLFGTKDFASPEHYGFGQTDARSDIFSVGALLNYMLTGENYKFRLPEDMACQVVVKKATALSRDERYMSAKEMLTALEYV